MVILTVVLGIGTRKASSMHQHVPALLPRMTHRSHSQTTLTCGFAQMNHND